MTKIINSVLILLFAGCLITACDKLPDELFVKKVIFTNNGFVEYPLNLTVSGDTTVYLPVSVSGTSANTAEVHVKFKLDTQTLEAYNYDKYRNLVSSYYSLLPEECYALPANEAVIESGHEYGLLPLKIHFDRIDKYGRFVLPLTLIDPSHYETDSIHSKVLLNINLSNRFSGTYSLVGSFLYEGADELEITGQSKKLSAVDYNTCFLYAGDVTELSADFGKYIMEVSFNEADSTLSYNASNSELELTAPAPNRDNKTNIYIVEEMAKEGTKTKTQTICYMEYSYRNLATNVIRKFEGTLVIQR